MSNTISATTVSASGGSGTSNSSAAAQIKSINQEIEKLTTKLSTLKDSGLTTDELQKQQQQIQSQIAALRAEIARIQAKEADKAKEDNNNVSTPAADGVNHPTDQNLINVYI
ncbi:FlxA-like family protein [Yersinia aldovae]|uniref:FlxA-like family protein n=1 Tax=Yersinia aldovae TaxID=29483 RepID=UPI0011A78DF1|nr:FlxA-like family protein [Yersinia aldovae]